MTEFCRQLMLAIDRRLYVTIFHSQLFLKKLKWVLESNKANPRGFLLQAFLPTKKDLIPDEQHVALLHKISGPCIIIYRIWERETKKSSTPIVKRDPLKQQIGSFYKHPLVN